MVHMMLKMTFCSVESLEYGSWIDSAALAYAQTLKCHVRIEMHIPKQKSVMNFAGSEKWYVGSSFRTSAAHFNMQTHCEDKMCVRCP